MIRISQFKLPVGHSEAELLAGIRRTLRLKKNQPFSYEIRRRSLDARRKPELFYVYSIDVKTAQEERLVSRLRRPNVAMAKEPVYRMEQTGTLPLRVRPVVVGAGPCGLFAAYQLALAGFDPLVLERGKCVENRRADVERFWETGLLLPESNVQFGEGGAGAFSDGKLNTAVRDPSGRNRFVLETFVKFGAPSEILYDAKPHIGTDILSAVIANMRAFLQEQGARICFETCVDNFVIEDGRLVALVCGDKKIPAAAVILAPGHSARDTFRTLFAQGVPMEPKNFAVGFRVEHPQAMIDEAMYGSAALGLPAAPYKVTANFPNGRGVYSFCMCPGGYVVNASSEQEKTCVNGMSYSGRSGANANSAVIVSVTTADFDGADALCGMRFQQELERRAFLLGDGIPQQLYGDFVQNKVSAGYGAFASQAKGKTCFANLRGLLSLDMERSFLAGMEQFAQKIPSFDREDAILSGVESRTSSPVRILRDAQGESAVAGLYPGGEGAGYAGGILSAAIDGLKLASALMAKYRPAYE